MLALFLDEDSMGHGLVRALRLEGIDVVTIAEARRRGSPDAEQLRYAAAEQRVIYTCNVADFARLHNELLSKGLHHAGIIVLTEQRTGVGTLIKALIDLVSTLEPADMRDRLEFLSNWLR